MTDCERREEESPGHGAFPEGLEERGRLLLEEGGPDGRAPWLPIRCLCPPFQFLPMTTRDEGSGDEDEKIRLGESRSRQEGKGTENRGGGEKHRDGGVSVWRANATPRRFPVLLDEALIVNALARSFPCQGSTVVVTFSQRRWHGQ